MIGAVTGKIDGLMFLVGAMGGMVAFGFAYPAVEGLFMAGEIEGSPTVASWLGVRPGIIALGMTVVAIVGFVGAHWAEKRFGKGPVQP